MWNKWCVCVSSPNFTNLQRGLMPNIILFYFRVFASSLINDLGDTLDSAAHLSHLCRVRQVWQTLSINDKEAFKKEVRKRGEAGKCARYC